MPRKLRIAFSVACAVNCLLLVVLWIRSYYWRDFAKGQVLKTCVIQCVSTSGQLVCIQLPSSKPVPWQWDGLSEAAIEKVAQRDRRVVALLRYQDKLRARVAFQIDPMVFRQMEVDNSKIIDRLDADIEVMRADAKQIVLQKNLGSALHWLRDFSLQFGFGFKPSRNGFVVGCPHWALIGVSALIATVLAKPTAWHFSLRTLLITITLIALMLGFVVLADK